jgi:hypothetical protein
VTCNAIQFGERDFAWSKFGTSSPAQTDNYDHGEPKAALDIRVQPFAANHAQSWTQLPRRNFAIHARMLGNDANLSP